MQEDVSPELFLDAVLGFEKTAAIKAALALDLFSAIAATDGTPEAIGTRVEAATRGVRVLCDYLTVNGFLEKVGTRYRLTPSTAMFLTKSSPAWLGSVVDFLAAPEMIALWLDDPVSYVRNGGSVGLANLAPDHPLWVTFAKAMVPFMAPVAGALALEVGSWQRPVRRVLDVAAGHGLFGIEIGKVAPAAAITALDWAPVLEVAKANAAKAGLTDRYHVKPGSAFDVDWGSDFDLVLLTNFLHHFDREACITLLAKARGSLHPQGRVVAVEFVPNEDRVSPSFPAVFAFQMLGSTPRGDAYTASELTEIGQAACFGRVDVRSAPPTPQSFITFERA